MGRRAGGVARVLAAVALAALPPVSLSAQLAPNRAATYLHPTDVQDPRAVWVNPGGLAVNREASIYAEVAVDDPGAQGRIRQIDAGFNSRGLSFAYQRDVFDGGARGHTYRLGLAGSAKRLSAGFAIARYGGTNTPTKVGWDLGAVYAWLPSLTVGGVIANIGQPSVRGVAQPVTFVPGITWRPFGFGNGAFSAHARLTSDSVLSYAFGLSWPGAVTSLVPVALFARLDTDGGLRRGAFAFGLSVGAVRAAGRDQAGLVASTPGDVSRVETVSLYGVSSRQATRRR